MCFINILRSHYKLLGILTMVAIKAPLLNARTCMDIEVIFDVN